MKLREVVRFEFSYQLRRVQTWLFFAALVVVAFIAVEANFLADARSGEYLLGSPYVVVTDTMIGSVFWLLVAAAVAGDAAARDAAVRMHPLTYTAPVHKADYLGGRFLAALVLNALMLLAVPIGIVLGVYAYGLEAELLGPFRLTAYLTAYGFIALPNAFAGTAIQFSFAALSRSAVASYMGGLLLLVIAFVVAPLLGREVAQLLDPTGVITVGEYLGEWSPVEKNTRLIGLEGSLLWNRLLWLGIALSTLALTYFRFQLSHHTATTWWSRMTRRHSPPADTGVVRNGPISVPQVRRTFGFTTHMRQALAIAWASFGSIVKSWGGLISLLIVTLLAVLAVDEPLKQMGVPLLPRTDYVLRSLIFPEIPPAYIIIPLLIVFWSGKLIWREREARVSEILDAAPVAEWVLFLGKFLGLSLVLAACQALRMLAGILIQVGMGYYDFELGLYLQILFGIQLADYLLLALLALVVHVVVNQRHVGHLAAFIAYGLIAFAPTLGIGHNLLIYGAGPGWGYTEMRGFGPSLGPWLWFKLYWTAWALLLAVVASLLWVRGRERGVKTRLGLARRRFTGPMAVSAAAAVGLILSLGGFIFYNTNVLNDYHTATDRMKQRAEYERRYGSYKAIPQPRLTGTNLHVEIYPQQRKADIRGSYLLVNATDAPIDSIHLATATEVETREVAFDRPAKSVLTDENLGHRIYALEQPLQPGDSLRLSFAVRVEASGFRHDAVLPADAAITANGTYFTNEEWLPAIGYQADRELNDARLRRMHGLAPRPFFRSVYDVEARQDSIGEESISFEAVVGTAENQTAVAPGALRRTWTEGGRRYFHYATDAPIGNEYAFFSADYAIHEGKWQDVVIRIFHHPGHTTNVDRMLRSVQASLDYYTQQFGPYPYSHISLVERPGLGGMHAYASLITFQEGFSLFHPEGDPGAPDFPFSVVAHEVAHQWWGSYLSPVRVEGNALLAEGLAQYSAYQVVRNAYGHDHLRWLILSEQRGAGETPRTGADVPLLRAMNDYHAYSKGPWAMYAVSEYIGGERVNLALRRLVEAHRSGALLTTLDLYRELQAVTPDSMQYLLHDLFEANTFWQLGIERTTAKQLDASTWQVTLQVQGRKVVFDEAGVTTEVPLDDWVEVGVFAAAQEGDEPGGPLYLQKHRIGAGEQTITVTVSGKPARAGIDPYHLLFDLDTGDNLTDVLTGNKKKTPPSSRWRGFLLLIIPDRIQHSGPYLGQPAPLLRRQRPVEGAQLRQPKAHLCAGGPQVPNGGQVQVGADGGVLIVLHQAQDHGLRHAGVG